MKYFVKKSMAVVASVTLLLSLAACGGGGSDGTSSATTSVSGTVFAGPVAGSSVRVKDSAGSVIAGPATTLADGTYTVAIPNTALTTDLIFEASGGTFPDEATAPAVVTLDLLSTHVPAGTLTAGATVTIDPSSTIIRELIRGGKTRAAALTAFNNAFGYTPDNSVKPVFAGISSASTITQRLAGLRAAAFSQLAKNLGIPAARQHELMSALAEDLADDALDGLKTGGTAVTTASGNAVPLDIANRFGQALVGFQLSANNRSKLKPDQIGAPAFHKKAVTTSHIVEYLPGTMAAATGKSQFRIKLSNLDGTPASGKTLTLRPYMYMSTKSHTTPMESVVDNGDGTYSCTVYYVMPTAMNGVSMGIWELTVTVDGTESARFYPVVGMPMGGATTLAKLSGVIDRTDPANPVDTDSIMGMAGKETRTWFLFNDGLSGMAGSNTFKLFLATKEMANSMLTFPAVKIGDTLLDQSGTPWTVSTLVVEVSTDKTNWIPATDSGNGHWSAANLTGLAPGTAGSVYVRLFVNGLQKTTDGTGAGAANGFQTFTVTPMQ